MRRMNKTQSVIKELDKLIALSDGRFQALPIMPKKNKSKKSGGKKSRVRKTHRSKKTRRGRKSHRGGRKSRGGRR